MFSSFVSSAYRLISGQMSELDGRKVNGERSVPTEDRSVQSSSDEVASGSRSLESRKSGPSALFALLIGINEYQSPDVAMLTGAVRDAEDVQAYLVDEMHVPEENIRALHGAAATRARIIQSMTDLEADPRIWKGDPILIYFAGHGATADAPSQWSLPGTDDSKAVIEQILPYDFDCGVPRMDAIPDRTLGGLLQKLANAKGDNITVILDCCHSGSGTRSALIGGGARTTRVRGIGHTNVAVSPILDEKIWRPIQEASGARGATIPSTFAFSGLRSHVLLAACAKEQDALERDPYGGVFTHALLTALRAIRIDQITYRNFMNALDLNPAPQVPQCEGVNQDRIIFDSRIQSDSQPYHRVIRNSRNQWTMHIGTAYGVSQGAQFAMYRNKSGPPEELGTFTASSVAVDSCVLEADPANPAKAPEMLKEAFVLQTRAGEEEDLHIFVNPAFNDAQLKNLMEGVRAKHEKTSGQRRIHLCSDEREAQLAVTLRKNGDNEGDKELVWFDILDERLRKHGLSRLDFPAEPHVDDVYRITRAAAHFCWHLRRPGRNPGLRSKVKFELVEVFADENDPDDDSLQPTVKPVEPPVSHVAVDGEIAIDVPPVSRQDTGTLYGVKITNELKAPIYVSLFSFNPVDLSIDSYYDNGDFGRAPALPARGEAVGELSIAYGTSGAAPYRYFLRNDKDNIERSPAEGLSRAGVRQIQNRVTVFETLVISIVQRLKVT